MGLLGKHQLTFYVDRYIIEKLKSERDFKFETRRPNIMEPKTLEEIKKELEKLEKDELIEKLAQLLYEKQYEGGMRGFC